MEAMLGGAIAMASIVIAMFFLSYWKRTNDRFFLLFSLSFLIQAINRIILVLLPTEPESSAMHYAIRIVAYGLILIAILDKNRGNAPGNLGEIKAVMPK